MVQRDLTGIYFRVERDNKYESIDITDLDAKERAHVIDGKPTEWYKNMIFRLCDIIRDIGDGFDIFGDF